LEKLVTAKIAKATEKAFRNKTLGTPSALSRYRMQSFRSSRFSTLLSRIPQAAELSVRARYSIISGLDESSA
jgi:hypothetical protein